MYCLMYPAAGSHFFREGADGRNLGALQYPQHDDGLNAAIGYIPSPLVTSSSPRRHRQNRNHIMQNNHIQQNHNHSPISPSPPTASRCNPEAVYNNKNPMAGGWNHGNYSHHTMVNNRARKISQINVAYKLVQKNPVE